MELLLGYLETRQWDKAWLEFERLSEAGPPNARLWLQGSLAAFGRADYFRARQLADRALTTWGPSDAPKLLGQIRFHLGMVTRKIGDSHVAVEQFQLFISELSSKYPELIMGEGKAYFYLALTLRERRDLEGAVAAYQKAVGSFRRDGLPSLLCASLQNFAWLLCTTGRTAEAADALSEASTLAKTSEDHIHQTLGEAYLASVQGHYAQATELCEMIFRRAERGESVDPEERAQAAWIAGTIAMHQGNHTGAAALADIALTHATDAKDSRLMNDANNLKRSIHMKQQAGA